MRLDMLGATALVLLAVDEPLRLASRPAAVIQAEVANDALDQAQLVVGIEDLEAFRQAGFLPVGTQQPVGNAMEGADPHAAGGHMQQVLDAAAHLVGGLVGESNR